MPSHTHTRTHAADSLMSLVPGFNVQEDTCYGSAGPMSRSLYIKAPQERLGHLYRGETDAARSFLDSVSSEGHGLHQVSLRNLCMKYKVIHVSMTS